MAVWAASDCRRLQRSQYLVLPRARTLLLGILVETTMWVKSVGISAGDMTQMEMDEWLQQDEPQAAYISMLQTEVSRRHHKKDHKHDHKKDHKRHSKHHHKHNNKSKTEEASESVVALGAQAIDPSDQVAIEADTAKVAANTAKVAAQVANKVADHSVKVMEKSQSALKDAKEALHGARVNAAGLSSDQKEALEKAEEKLHSASRAGDYGKLETARYQKAEGRDHTQEKVDELQHKLDEKDWVHNSSIYAKCELEVMREELQKLRQVLVEIRTQGVTAEEEQSILEMEGAINELDTLLADLQKQEQAGGYNQSHDELKAEIERLREAVYRFKRAHEKARRERNALTYTVPDDAQAAGAPGAGAPGYPQADTATPCPDQGGMDIDTSMPYGDLEPFGRENTAQELTEASIHESDEMVDQLERAEVAEEKRAVFRALTRLRGAAITSFDGVARSQTGNIDEYAKVHKWRMTHPLHHLADEESDVTKWAFPDNADF